MNAKGGTISAGGTSAPRRSSPFQKQHRRKLDANASEHREGRQVDGVRLTPSIERGGPGDGFGELLQTARNCGRPHQSSQVERVGRSFARNPVGPRVSLLPALASADQPPLTSIFLTGFWASGVFGSVTVSTPFLKLASILSNSTVSGTRSERVKEPKRRSLRCQVFASPADGLLHGAHRHPGRGVHRLRGRRLPLSGDCALKVVSNKMQDFGSVHVRSSLSLRRSEEHETHDKRMILQVKVKWICGVLLDLACANANPDQHLDDQVSRPDPPCANVNGVRARHERDPENCSDPGRRCRRLQPARRRRRGSHACRGCGACAAI